MKLRRYIGTIYAVLVGLLLIMGLWWVYFLSQEGSAQAELQLQLLQTERALAEAILRNDRGVPGQDASGTSVSELRLRFPDLKIITPAEAATGQFEIAIDPEARTRIRREAQRRRNMFLYEGAFFLVLLSGAAMILILAYRSERAFKQARELFLAGATHDFKTPLASLRLYTETLQREGLPDRERGRIRRHMIENIEQLESLVNQVLALSDFEAFRPEPKQRLDLAVECRRVLAELEGYLGAHEAQIEAELAEGHFILGGSLPLLLTVRNLLQNAVKYSPRPARIRLDLHRDGRWHRLTIADQGPGIARRLHDKVFECFYSSNEASRPSPSAGLGLYLVRRNIEGLGGRVELDSDVGRGTAFTLVLPVYEGDDL